MENERQIFEFIAALKAFKQAAFNLSDAWENADNGDMGESYPIYLPDFSSFCDDVAAWHHKQLESFNPNNKTLLWKCS